MKFKENIEITETKITIAVSCERRKYAFEEKRIYEKEVQQLIPEELKPRVKLISFPKKTVANINDIHYTNNGVWVYEIEPLPPEPKIETIQQPKKQKIESEPKTTKTRQTRARRTRKPRSKKD